jgi:predicted nucleotidyltransferase
MKIAPPPEELAVILPALVVAHDPDEVLLFGSRAKNVARHDSDWDLLVLIPDASVADRPDESRRLPAVKTAGLSTSLVISGTDGFHSVKHVANTLGREISADAVVLYRREGWIPPSTRDEDGTRTMTRYHVAQCRKNLRAAEILSAMPYGRRRQLQFAAGDLLTALATMGDVHLTRVERGSLLAMAVRVSDETVAPLMAGFQLLDLLETMEIEELAEWAGAVPDGDLVLLDELAEGLEQVLCGIETEL